MRILPYCRLTLADRAYIEQCGLPEEDVLSFPDSSWLHQLIRDLERFIDPRYSVTARRWNKRHHDELRRHLWRLPGVYAVSKRSGKGFYNRITPAEHEHGYGALAIMIRDVAGYVVALTFRHRDGERDSAAPRYTWHSTRQTPSGAPVHVARPAAITDGSKVLITEGAKKAIVAARRLGCIAIGLPGINIQGDVVRVLDELAKRGEITPGTHITIAYDAEPEKPQVAAARDRLAQRIMEAKPDAQVYIAEWEPAAGKGLDDLLLAGGTFTECQYVPKVRRGIVEYLDIVPIPQLPTCTLDEATEAFKRLVETLIPMKVWPGDVADWHIMRMSPGGGKTGLTLSHLNRLLSLDDGALWPQVTEVDGTTRRARILYLCDTLEVLAEKTGQYLHAMWGKASVSTLDGGSTHRWIWRRMPTDRFWIVEGRNPAPESEAFCGNSSVISIAENRHLVPIDICNNPEHPCSLKGACETTGYLHSRRHAKVVPLVLATKAAYLNGSEGIGEFDLVVLDEDACDSFLEEVRVTRSAVDLWRRLQAERDTTGMYPKLDEFLMWLQAAGAHAATHVPARREVPALSILREIAPADAVMLIHAAIGTCTDLRSRDIPRAECERPHAGAPVPLRAIYDFATTLDAEWKRPDSADSRLRFDADGTLILRLPRLHLLRLLAQRRVLWLDATPDIAQIQQMARLARPGEDVAWVHEHDLRVATHVDVIQATDSRFSPETLRRDAHRELHAIAETMHAVATARNIPDHEIAVIARRAFDPNAEEHCEDDVFARFSGGHFGKDDKATDRFKGCRLLVTVGAFTPNISSIEARIAAWRYAEHPPQATATRRVLRYPGTRCGIERDDHADPEVQAAIDHATWVHETQALGRLRAVRRDGEHLVWLRFNNAPYADLPVTTLVTHNDLRIKHGLPALERLSEAQREALRRESDRQAEAAREKCARAYTELHAQGVRITVSALRRQSGVRLDAVRRYLASIQDCQQAGEERSQGGTLDNFQSSSALQRTPSELPPAVPQESRQEADSPPMPPPPNRSRRLPLWSDALRVVGWNASESDVWRAWWQLVAQSTSAYEMSS